MDGSISGGSISGGGGGWWRRLARRRLGWRRSGWAVPVAAARATFGSGDCDLCGPDI